MGAMQLQSRYQTLLKNITWLKASPARISRPSPPRRQVNDNSRTLYSDTVRTTNDTQWRNIATQGNWPHLTSLKSLVTPPPKLPLSHLAKRVHYSIQTPSHTPCQRGDFDETIYVSNDKS
ncbi:hypothetical protein [Desulfuromonas acetoxidans]|uniref:hypothetical protein n=1 Tax=Desulfuromonas acetoxidans TaxID=891 RepID=UPI00293046B2|nr:hypothetical protein [Desulfuromonas acetoxidans]